MANHNCPELISQIKSLLNQYESSQNQPITCPQTKEPCVTCCMVCPPPIMAPTVPEPVRPLQLPCPVAENQSQGMSDADAEKFRIANFYNNYNIDWRSEASRSSSRAPDPRTDKYQGVTTDGKSPYCPEALKKQEAKEDHGCPTGFKPCKMKLAPPKDCHPCGVWCAEIQACPPTPKKRLPNRN
ncbi:unnamed protein product [Ceutorhynchus assimilis]|uniref:Uncharacterized protein n=1 Tax=Ceutorhynchus assimilis TaxID=467358 RepID=A0A9P0GPB3_9CUCU|nr:unnamed protein product [Ceutorhynchus assimilis]